MDSVRTGKLKSNRHRASSEDTYHDLDVEEALLKDSSSSGLSSQGIGDHCSSCWQEVPTDTRGALHKSLPVLRIFVVLFSLWGVVDLSLKAMTLHRQFTSNGWHALTKEDPTCFCGNSVAEAKALGCKYDSLAQGWLPDHCRDDELVEEFERSGPNEGGGWSFFREKNHTTPMTYEDVSLLADTGGHWYVEWDWHAAHCIYYWKKQWRSWHRNGHELYETTTGAYEHIAHCENAIRWTYKGTTGWVNIGGDH